MKNHSQGPSLHALPTEQEKNFTGSSLTPIPTARKYMEYLVQEEELENVSSLSTETTLFASATGFMASLTWDVLRGNYQLYSASKAWQNIILNDAALVLIVGTVILAIVTYKKHLKRKSKIDKIRKNAVPVVVTRESDN